MVSQSSDTLTIVHGSNAFQWKSTTLSLHESEDFMSKSDKQTIQITLAINLKKIHNYLIKPDKPRLVKSATLYVRHLITCIEIP